MPRFRDPKIAWDVEIGGFRAVEQPLAEPKVDRHAPWNQQLRQARAHVTGLLADAFGRRLSSGASGVQVPAHLRPYLRPGKRP